jgi:hypothetical protein
METIQNPGSQLLQEFTKITEDLIMTGYVPYKIETYEGPGEIEFYEDFDFIFQKKFKRKSIRFDDYMVKKISPDSEYHQYLDDIRLSFYTEIDSLIENGTSTLIILNKLTFYQNRFSELLTNYYDEECTFSSDDSKTTFKEVYKCNRKVLTDCDKNNAVANSFFEYKLLDSFLRCQTDTLELILKFLVGKIDLIKTYPKENEPKQVHISTKVTVKIKPLEKRSFELNPEIFKSEQIATEKMQDFKNALLKYGYIEQIDIRYVYQIFKNQDIEQPIRWLGTPSELYYLIKNLYDKNLIIRFKNFWSVACKCFIAYDKRKTLCTPYYLQRCKSPTRGDQLRILNSIIDTLK